MSSRTAVTSGAQNPSAISRNPPGDASCAHASPFEAGVKTALRFLNRVRINRSASQTARIMRVLPRQEVAMFRGLLSVAVLVAFPTFSFAQQPCTRDARRVVDELYRHILERSADASSQVWADKLMSGATVREVVNAIVDSPEHMQRFSAGGERAGAD